MADVVVPNVMVKSDSIYKVLRPEDASYRLVIIFMIKYYIEHDVLKKTTLNLSMLKSIPKNRIFFYPMDRFTCFFSLYRTEATKETA